MAASEEAGDSPFDMAADVLKVGALVRATTVEV